MAPPAAAPPSATPASSVGNGDDPFAGSIPGAGTNTAATAQTPPPASSPQLGWSDVGPSLRAGVEHSFGDLYRTGQAITGGTPTDDRAASPAAQGYEWSDILNPGSAVSKFAYGFGNSFPTLATGIGMGAAGAAAGAPTGPGAPFIGIGTGAAGAAAMSMLQTLGPELARELKATPNDVDGAWNRAVKSTMLQGGITGAAWAMFPTRFIQGPIKNAVFQMFGIQPGLAVANQVGENFIHGRPTLENAGSAYGQGVVNTAIPMLGNRVVNGHWGSVGEQEAPPRIGLGTDERLAAMRDWAARTNKPIPADALSYLSGEYMGRAKAQLGPDVAGTDNPFVMAPTWDDVGNGIRRRLVYGGFDPRQQSDLFNAVDSLAESRRGSGHPVDLEDIGNFRRTITGLLNHGDEATRTGAMQALRMLDGVVNDRIADVSPRAAESVAASRQLDDAATAMRGWEQIVNRVSLADDKRATFRHLVADIVADPRRYPQFSDAAIQAMRDMLRTNWYDRITHGTHFADPTTLSGLLLDFGMEHFLGHYGLLLPAINVASRVFAGNRTLAGKNETSRQILRQVPLFSDAYLPSNASLADRMQRRGDRMDMWTRRDLANIPPWQRGPGAVLTRPSVPEAAPDSTPAVPDQRGQPHALSQSDIDFLHRLFRPLYPTWLSGPAGAGSIAADAPDAGRLQSSWPTYTAPPYAHSGRTATSRRAIQKALGIAVPRRDGGAVNQVTGQRTGGGVLEIGRQLDALDAQRPQRAPTLPRTSAPVVERALAIARRQDGGAVVARKARGIARRQDGGEPVDDPGQVDQGSPYAAVRPDDWNALAISGGPPPPDTHVPVSDTGDTGVGPPPPQPPVPPDRGVFGDYSDSVMRNLRAGNDLAGQGWSEMGSGLPVMGLGHALAGSVEGVMSPFNAAIENFVERPATAVGGEDFGNKAGFLASLPFGGGEGAMAHGIGDVSHAMIFPAPALMVARAQRLERAGATPEEIWQEVQAYRGADGKWRTEILGPSRLRSGSISTPTRQAPPTTVGEALNAPHIFRRMPDLANIPVTSEVRPGAADLGEYRWAVPGRQGDQGAIWVSPRAWSGIDSRTPFVPLMHELQHGIQQRTGLSGQLGGDRNWFRNADKNDPTFRFFLDRLKETNDPDRAIALAERDRYLRSAAEVEARNASDREDFYNILRRVQGKRSADETMRQISPTRTETLPTDYGSVPLPRHLQLVGPPIPRRSGGRTPASQRAVNAAMMIACRRAA